MANMETSRHKQLRILLVEDDEDYAFSIVRLLEKSYLLEYTKTEAEALRKLYTESYDVLLLDLNLSTGYLSGFQFLDYLNRLPRFKDLIIIGISGMSLDDIHSNPSFNKLNAFLIKPVTKEVLIETIENCAADGSQNKTDADSSTSSEETAEEEL